MVRRGGLEPPRCYPLAPQASASANSAISAKLNPSTYFFAGGNAGVGAGTAGVGTGIAFCCRCCCTGAFLLRFSRTLPELRAWLFEIIPKLSEVIMKSPAATVVAFDKTVAVPRGPNTVCEPMPPNAPARSAAFPLCNRTTRIKIKHTITCTVVTAMRSQDITF